MIKDFDANSIYEKIKKKNTRYVEKIHCPLVIDRFHSKGTVSSFCVEIFISDSTFYSWVNKYPMFAECYRLGHMIAKENWEEEGRIGKDEDFFNLDYWKVVGSSRFGVGRTNRIRVDMGADSSPYDQYKHLITQASMGEYTAAEIKQLMESINVGIRVYESFKLQDEVDKMKSDLLKMKKNDGNSIIAIEGIKKAN